VKKDTVRKLGHLLFTAECRPTATAAGV